MGNSKSKHSNEAAERQNTSDDDETTAEPEQLSYWQMIKHGYQELVNAIIRPPRCQYEVSKLGPKFFDYCGKSFQRIDFDVTNERGLKVVCSMWEPTTASRNNVVLPCVIYMHGNSSARPEALGQLSLVLSLGATLVTFDFCGSGMSDGEYVSLGFFEKDDLKAVIEYLRNSGTTSTIALWGRSMGAATALLHGERDPSISGMILDSAFADLQMLAEEMVEKGRQSGLVAPSFVVKIAIRMIRGSVSKTAGFDIRQLSPIEHADRCFIPTMFVAAGGDEFVPPHHSQNIFEKYAGDKNIIIVEGDHNSNRPSFLFDSALIFLVHVLQIPEAWIMTATTQSNGGLPWQTRRSAPSTRQIRQVANGVEESNRSTWNDSVDGTTGYTNEMQANVRGKLFSMLGDRGEVAAAAAAASSSSRSPNKSNAQPGSAVGPVSNGKSVDNNVPPEDFSLSHLDGVEIGFVDDSAFDYSDDTEEKYEWVCSTCTLINEPDSFICVTCESLRFQ